MMNQTNEHGNYAVSMTAKCRWWMYYHTQTAKGRFEVYHFLEWLCFMAVGIACVEAVLVWLGV